MNKGDAIKERFGEFLRENADVLSGVPADLLRAYAILVSLPSATTLDPRDASTEELVVVERALAERDRAFQMIIEHERTAAQKARAVRKAFFNFAASLGSEVLTVLGKIILSEIREDFLGGKK